MSPFEHVVQQVGHLSFRNKLRATAIIFGVPLLIASAVILVELGTRVSLLEREKAALAIQMPAQSLFVTLYQYQAASLADQEGVENFAEKAKARRAEAIQALARLEAAFAAQKIDTKASGDSKALLGRWAELAKRIEASRPDAIAEIIGGLHAELEKLNEATGILIDGDASSSRLLDVTSTHLSGLIAGTGQAASLGAITLAKKSLRSSRRTDLTVVRGNFDALVQWSMNGLDKVAKEHPELASDLAQAAGRLNTAYLAVQEALTTKMLDSSDFDMTPEVFLRLTGQAFGESLAIGEILVRNTDILLTERLTALQTQRNGVFVIMLLGLALVMASFIAAYTSIMRGLNGLSQAVSTMAAGNLGARVEITSRDEIGDVSKQFNHMVERLAERTAQLHEKTKDIHAMLQHMPQGILTVVANGKVHPEYSSYLENIFETAEISGRNVMDLLFAATDIGSDLLSQIDTTITSSIGEDRLNFDLNSHLLPGSLAMSMADGQRKCLEFTWSPITDENDTVEKILVCVRDVTALRELEADAAQQRREMQMIEQLLKVNQEKFHDFIGSAQGFIASNESLLGTAKEMTGELVTQLFRNMHTIKGNARTLGLLHLTNVVHEAEQSYDAFRKDPATRFDPGLLLDQLRLVAAALEDYRGLNDIKLGRKGPGRRGSAERYAMVERATLDRMIAEIDAINLNAVHRDTLAAVLKAVKTDLRLIGTASITEMLAGVFDSLPGLAKELAKESPRILIADNDIRIRTQASELLRNVFMHLCRNAMDHGIEAATERVAGGKPGAGLISVELQLDQEAFAIRLSDDGRGLAMWRLRTKGIAKGLLPESGGSDEEVANLAFAAGLSTATAVTEVSGRGVGMDAVKDFLTREGGKIQIRLADANVGAEFRAFETLITLPAKFAVTAASGVAADHPQPHPSLPAQHPEADLASLVRSIVPGQLAVN
jgi:methyl-accepting chemotaxis protein/HPt (histidine-containing phosphotransfer) domain-containing protein